MAETRKVQFTGSSSFILTLPKDWSRRVGLKRGDRLVVVEQPDGSLQVTPRLREDVEQRVAVIDVDVNQSPGSLTRVFISKYLAGYQLFRFVSNQAIPADLRKAIMDCRAGLLGLEVVEETERGIEVQDLLSPEELRVEKALRRAHLMASSMYDTAVNALETGNTRMAEDVMAREPAVDRLYFLVLRQLTLALQNPLFLRDLDIKAVEALDYQMLVKSIERIADHASRISRMIVETNLEEVDRDIRRQLVEVGRKAGKVNKDAVNAFFTRDIPLANEAVAVKDAVELELEALNRSLLEKPSKAAVNLRVITDSVERTADYGANMAEIAIDRNR